MKRQYVYSGIVNVNGHLNDSNFKAETIASSEREAKRNFIHQYIDKVNLPYSSKVELGSEIKGEKMYIFTGESYVQDKLVDPDLRMVVFAWDKEQARVRACDMYRSKQFISDEAFIQLKGEFKEKE